MIKVKICGIRSVEAAVAAVDAGADFIGLNFVPTSKRKVTIEQAVEIIEAVRNKVITVGIFQNQSYENIYEIKEYLGLDFIQLHGDESAEFSQKTHTHVIKTFLLSQEFNPEEIIEEMRNYSVDLYLVDRKIQGKGKMLPYDKIQIITSQLPVFLSGGLTPKNVAEAVCLAKPFAVDVAGGIETRGTQDVKKIELFIKNAKGAII